jgi:hypothetical protein
MTIVYLAEHSWYDDQMTIGVYTTLEKAQEAIMDHFVKDMDPRIGPYDKETPSSVRPAAEAFCVRPLRLDSPTTPGAAGEIVRFREEGFSLRISGVVEVSEEET